MAVPARTLAFALLSVALLSCSAQGSGDPQDDPDTGGDEVGGDSTPIVDSPTSDAPTLDAPSDVGGDTGGGVDTGSEASPVDTGPGTPLDPPAGATSGGKGGAAASGTAKTTPTGVTYRLIAPGSGAAQPLMIVFSGTEGGAAMTSNLQSVAPSTGTSAVIFAVLDGTVYYGKGAAGADVLDDVRKSYDVDNDRTYLLGESAGTTAALQLGFDLRQSWFAAYWANDVNARAVPSKNAATLGFAPFGNAGPGGDFADANAIVAAMKSAGYRVPPPAPYDGAGAGTHGSPNQFVAAVSWFPGKSRK